MRIMEKLDLINRLINESRFERYLEIGIAPTYATFDRVNVRHKVGVEPMDKTHTRSDGGQIMGLDSDAFFDVNKEKFQMIFIDGLHLFEQVAKDIVNSWNALEQGGFILVHDCMPYGAAAASRIHNDPTLGWSGDGYKAIVRFRDMFPDISCFVLPDDHGIGVIRKEDDRILENDYKDLGSYMDLSYRWLLENPDRIGLVDPDFKAGKLNGRSRVSHYLGIEGWCDYDDLYDHIAAIIADGETFMEVGAWLGRSICSFMAAIDRRGKKVRTYVVDTFKGSEEWKEARPQLIKLIQAEGGSVFNHFMFNITSLNLQDRITPLICESDEAVKGFPDESIFAVFIDASTIEASYLRDLEVWYPKIKRGGIISGHNFHAPTVCRAMRTFFFPKDLPWICIGNSGWMVKKP